MRRMIYMLAVVMMVLMPLSVQAANRALLVGVGKYQMKGADLPGIDKDIDMMHSVALSLGFTEDQIKTLQDDQATLANVQRAINDWLVVGVSPEDRVLFYFSGHGTQIYDRNNDELDKVDEVLVMHDTALGRNTLDNVLVDDSFNEMIERIPAESIVLLIDACHSGTITRGAPPAGLYPKYLRYPGMPTATRSASFLGRGGQVETEKPYSALSAAQDNQRAQASKQGSFFTLGVNRTVDEASRAKRGLNMAMLQAETTRYIATAIPDPAYVHSPALSGDMAVVGKNLFIQAKTSADPPDWKAEIEDVVKLGGYSIPIATNRRYYRTGEHIEIACAFAEPGYVNIITLQPGDKAPTILFPNKYHPDNRVDVGGKVSIPAPSDTFELTAAPPAGRALIAVFHTPHPVNFYTTGYGDGVFKMMRREQVRGIVVTGRPTQSGPSAQQEAARPPARFGSGITFVTIQH